MNGETQTTTSADGTTTAYQASGDGPTIVFVGGATQRKEDWAELVAAMSGAGFTAVTYDRRGGGDSGDTTPYAVEREVADLAAVIAANGGSAGLHGHSSGGALANRAAGAGVGAGLAWRVCRRSRRRTASAPARGRPRTTSSTSRSCTTRTTRRRCSSTSWSPGSASPRSRSTS
jgi:alpha-beta hydrolase superfamily lysophospholipase